MLERNFSSNFRREMEEVSKEPIHLVLLQDAPKSGKKPYDSYLIHDGIFTAMEFKVVKGLSVNGSIASLRQIECLLEASAAGANGYVVVYLERIKKVLFINVRAWMKIFAKEKSRKICYFENEDYSDVCSGHEKGIDECDVFMIERTKQKVVTDGKAKLTTRWDFDKMFTQLREKYYVTYLREKHNYAV